MEALLLLALIFAVAGQETLALCCVAPVFLFFAFCLGHAAFTFVHRKLFT